MGALPSVANPQSLIVGSTFSALALAASALASFTAGILAPLGLLLTLGMVDRAGVPLPLVTWAGVAGALSGALFFRQFSMRLSVVAVALSLIVFGTERLTPASTFALNAGVFALAASIAVLMSRLASFAEDLFVGTALEMKGVAAAALVFIAAYATSALIFALVYGVLAVADPSALTHSNESLELIQLFQWSLTILVAGGSDEFAPSTVLARTVYIFELLTHFFITGVFLGYFLTHASKLASKESQSGST